MSDLKSSYDHLIVGGGVAADKAARAIRKAEPDASIAIISADQDGPVYRPALTKDLWLKSDPDPASQDLHTAAETDAEVFTDLAVSALDPAAHTVTTTAGQTVKYRRLLLATGSSPRRFAGVDDSRVVYVRTVADYRHLRDLVGSGTRVAVVGGGYIGSEISAALSATGAKVTNYFRGQRLLEHMFPTSIVDHLEEVFRQRGIELADGFELDSIDAASPSELTLRGRNGEEVAADVAVLGLGAVLNTALAEEAGLTMEGDAVVVDEQLRTSAPDVWAAGDIIYFKDPIFGHRHLEHIDNAWRSGTRAGKAMTGAQVAYGYTPLFYSDLFDDGYEAIGHLSTSHDVHEVWNDDRTAAVIWYLAGGKVAGVLLWNTWDAVPAAREAVAKSRAGELSVDELAVKITPGG